MNYMKGYNNRERRRRRRSRFSKGSDNYIGNSSYSSRSKYRRSMVQAVSGRWIVSLIAIIVLIAVGAVCLVQAEFSDDEQPKGQAVASGSGVTVTQTAQATAANSASAASQQTKVPEKGQATYAPDGVANEIAAVPTLALAEKKGETPFFFILDGIEDPHNLGAIIRTANLAGAHGVILPKRRAAGLTATVVKASAGAIHYTPVAKVTNIVSTIEQLKEKGMWFVCADMDGELMYRQNLTGPIGLVIGNEGKGVSRLVKEHCDFISSIPMKGDIDSLNASVAAGVLAYEIVRQRMNH